MSHFTFPVEVGQWVCTRRGERRGQQAKVVSVYRLSAGQVAVIEYQDGEHLECFSSLLVGCEAPAIRSVGKFSLLHKWCPHTNQPGQLELGSDRYCYHEVNTASPSVFRCFRMVKQTGRITDRDGYNVVFLRNGQEQCDCADFTYRKSLVTNGRCKHLQAASHLLMVDEVEEAATPICEDPFGGICLSETRDTFDGWFDRREAMVNRCESAFDQILI